MFLKKNENDHEMRDGLCWTKKKRDIVVVLCELNVCMEGAGTGGRVFMSFCNIADCDNLILQLMLIGIHCAASLETPHMLYCGHY